MVFKAGFTLQHLSHCSSGATQQGLCPALTKVRHLSQLRVGSYQQVHQVEQIDATQDEEKDLETLQQTEKGDFKLPSIEPCNGGRKGTLSYNL